MSSTPQFNVEQLAAARSERWHQSGDPLLTLEGLSLHWEGMRAVYRREVRSTRLESVLLGVHVVGYLTAVFWVLSPLQAVVFIAVHQAAWGVYMGCSFAPNHKGMPMPTAADQLDYLRKHTQCCGIARSRHALQHFFSS